MTAVLIIGVDPSAVDPTDPAVPRGTTPESVARGLEEALAGMRGRGWTADHCAILPDENVETTITAALRGLRSPQS